MKYLSKCFLIYSLIFSLVNLSITSTGITLMKPAMAQDNLGGNTRRADAQEQLAQEQAEQELQSEQARQAAAGLNNQDAAANSPGNKRISGEAKRLQTAEWLSLLNMLAIAMVAASLMQYKWTTDLKIVAAGGAAFIAGEVYAIMKYKSFNKKKIQEFVEFKERSDGSVTMTDQQLKAMETQKEAYAAAKRTAQTKSMLQGAAAVAFAAGSFLALKQEVSNNRDLANCVGSIKSDRSTGYVECKKACTAVGVMGGAGGPACMDACNSCQASLNRGIEVITNIQVVYNAPGMSCMKHPKLIKGHDELKGILNAGPCIGVPSMNTAGRACTAAFAKVDLTQTSKGKCDTTASSKLETMNKEKLAVPKVMSRVARYIAPEKIREIAMESGTFEADKDKVAELLKDNGFQRFSRTYGDGFYGASLNVLDQSEEATFKNYLKMHENQRFYEGKLSSITLDEYHNFQQAFSPEKNLESKWEIKETLKVAMEKGIDLIFPRAEAYLTQGLGLSAVAVGVLMSMKNMSMTWIDVWLAVPKHRAFVFAGMAAIATASVVLTRGIITEMDENIQKLDDVISRMKRLNNGTQRTQELTNNTGEIVQATKEMQFVDADAPIAPEGEKFDCISTNKQGKCVSLKRSIETSTDFSTLGDGIGQVASLSGSLADGISNKSNLSKGTLNAANQLSSLKNAVGKHLKKQRIQFNKLRKSRGEKPIDFDRRVAKFKRGIENALLKGLKRSGVNAQDALANSNILLPKDIKEGKQKEKVADIKPAAVKKIASIYPNYPTSKFKFEGLSEEELLMDEPGEELFAANDNAINELNSAEESTDDINGDSTTSIFNMISVRYMKTGLSRLLGKKPARIGE